jgi:procollagen-lysine,2-oxoglutarate 5-dioxygenase, invertebrate
VTNAYNVIFTQGPEFVLNKFDAFKPARIVFGAEDICWPDANLQVRGRLFFPCESIDLSSSQYDYPLVDSNQKRFLNSGGFIGYAADIYAMLASAQDVSDPQLFFTKLYLDEATRVRENRPDRID